MISVKELSKLEYDENEDLTHRLFIFIFLIYIKKERGLTFHLNWKKQIIKAMKILNELFIYKIKK